MEKLFQEYENNELHQQLLTRFYLVFELSPSESELKSAEEYYDFFTENYKNISDDAFKQLKRLHKRYSIDVRSAEFKSTNGDKTEKAKLKIVITNLITSLAFRHEDEVINLLHEIGYPSSFTKLFVDINSIIKQIQFLNKEMNFDVRQQLWVFIKACYIINLQIMFKIEVINGDIVPEYSGSADVAIVKIELDKLIRKRKKGQDKLNLSPEFSKVEAILKLESGLFTAQFLQRNMARNKQKDADGSPNFNIGGMAYLIFQLCDELNHQSKKDHVYLALYPLFKVLYPIKNFDAKENSENPIFSDQNGYYYTRDYKIGMVKSILGITG